MNKERVILMLACLLLFTLVILDMQLKTGMIVGSFC